jgi:ATP-dependent helicase/nuclease subunit A
MNILDKNLLILASAGSGKTYQLGNRVIGIAAKGAPPERIVALTFTRKAAGEFADSVLMKLAAAAGDGEVASRLAKEIGVASADFPEILAKVVSALPRLTLGTMDSFFAKVVRGFQYELGLTGGKFELIEGPRAAAAREQILAEILGERLEQGTAGELLHVFRRATYGKENARVGDSFAELVSGWQGRYRSPAVCEWGPAALAGAAVGDWEERKHELASKIRRGLDSLDYTDKRQRNAMDSMIDSLESHTVAGGGVGNAGTLFKNVCEVIASGGTTLEVKSYKPFVIGGPAGEALREMVLLAAHCEMAAAIERTRAVRGLVADFDKQCEDSLRRRGLLGFDDVKVLMGQWVTGENARLRREAVDFRLDARYDHWLLDEFQDTSGPDWRGLFPLIDEAASDDTNTMFIVGDRKQAIYGWRGGEVGLFDDVIGRYQLDPGRMVESFRSCPEVLELVNRVCGDLETMRSLFGEAAGRWEWEDHVSSARLGEPSYRGESRVEVVGDWDERIARTAEILEELGAGSRAMTCGVLLRSNTKVKEIADYLRERNFDVIEDGRREPAKDNPVGVVFWHLLKWLANPEDSFSWEVVGMSPIAAVLENRFGQSQTAIWEGLSLVASEQGFAAMTEGIAEACWDHWSAFGRRRAGDIIGALSAFDASGAVTAGEAADWIGRLEVSQSPGIAAVQVMTVHKSKGLGFDAVILPDIPDDPVPSAGDFDVAEGEGWICQPPASWARALLPEMRAAEARWAADQRYEATCLLYVALTRAKRGLYVLLEPPSKSMAADKPSLSNWLATSVESSGNPGDVVFQEGSPGWVANVPAVPEKQEVLSGNMLGKAVPRRSRTSPSGEKKPLAGPVSVAGMRFGNEVHAIFETIGWVDEASPQVPGTPAGAKVAALLEVPEIKILFGRNGREVELFREQGIEAIVDGRWLSGAIDRLHVHRSSGKVVGVEVIDFKTDAVKSAADLIERYRGQMEAYRTVMRTAYDAEVRCLLVSTALHAVIEV